MPSFRHTIDIAATPEQVWHVLGDVTSVDRWIPGLTAVTRTGTGRVCTFADGHVQDEQILDYSPESYSFRYVIDGAPLPVRDNTGRFAVEDAGGHARVVWESSFVPTDPVMAEQLAQLWEPYLPMVLANLKRVVEGTVTAQLFARLSDELIGSRPEIEPARMFGSTGLKVHGKTFAMLVKGRLVVKMARDRVDELLATGAGEAFDPGHGRLMREWISLKPATDPATGRTLVTEALIFVAAAQPAGARRGRARTARGGVG